MPVINQDIIVHGSNVMPDDDTPTGIGGAIDTSKKVVFKSPAQGTMQYVSSAAGDTSQQVTASYLDVNNAVQTEVKTLNGQTPVAGTATMKYLLKAIKSATTSGDVAIETSTAERTGTAQAGAATTITLDSGASATDDAYKGMVLRVTGGTGAGQIREILSYAGATKIAEVSRAWGTNPDGTSTFRISKGMVFDKSPTEILHIRRAFYNAQANAAGGATKTYYEKIFIKNANGSSNLSTGTIALTDATGLVSFGVVSTLDDTGSNGAGNRQSAPSGITFDATTKNIANAQVLTFGAAQGVWLKLTLAGGTAPQDFAFTLTPQGVV